VPPTIVLPQDSMLRVRLLNAINSLLVEVAAPDSTRPSLYDHAKLSNKILFDEMHDIAKSGKYKDEHFYKPYLANMVLRSDSAYTIQINFIGIADTLALLRASFSMIARAYADHVEFYSPLESLTKDWKVQQMGPYCFHFRNAFNEDAAKNYYATIQRYDKKLGASSVSTDLYCCNDFQEALRLCGIDYKSDYNGRTKSSVAENSSNHELILNGVCGAEFGPVDPHDLWHARRSRVIPTNTTNKPVEEGFAFINGGSWGLSWQTILESFKKYVAAHPDADWLEQYNASTNIAEKGAYPLNIDYIINAMVVRDIESSKGFSVAKELLQCGVYQKGNANYFAALEKVTGVTIIRFNEYVKRLIANN